MSEPVILFPYDEDWKEQFQSTGRLLREALGSAAIRIDHIGSTAVPGLQAKPIIDIQVSVESLEPLGYYKPLLEKAGFFRRAHNPDLTKRYFREGAGSKRTHIHVREHGSWSEQLALLFRDYLRRHPEDGAVYVLKKLELAERHRHERERYVDGKEPVIWDILRRAGGWSQRVGWKPGPSDV